MVDTKAKKADGKERNKGPVVVTYVDNSGKADYARAPLNVAGVSVKARNGNAAQVYELSKLPDNVKNALVAFALASKMKTHINNHAEDDGANVVSLANSVYSDFVAGRITAKAEGGATRGKKFDPAIYVEATKQAFIFMAKKGLKGKNGQPIKPLTEDQLKDQETKLMSMSPKERTDKIRAMKSGNEFFKKALIELQARQVKVPSSTEAIDTDMF